MIETPLEQPPTPAAMMFATPDCIIAGTKQFNIWESLCETAFTAFHELISYGMTDDNAKQVVCLQTGTALPLKDGKKVSYLEGQHD